MYCTKHSNNLPLHCIIHYSYIHYFCIRVHYLMLIQVFQCLLIGGENAGPGALKNAESFVITDEQFESFIQRHRSIPQLVPESNTTMRDSYLILDEYVS